jgi:hypothetical protein
VHTDLLNDLVLVEILHDDCGKLLHGFAPKRGTQFLVLVPVELFHCQRSDVIAVNLMTALQKHLLFNGRECAVQDVLHGLLH